MPIVSSIRCYHSLFPAMPDTEIPSIWQFKHFYEREFPKVTQLTARSNPILYNKDIRALHLDSEYPGSRPGLTFMRLMQRLQIFILFQILIVPVFAVEDQRLTLLLTYFSESSSRFLYWF